jgi:hypothetical protein
MVCLTQFTLGCSIGTGRIYNRVRVLSTRAPAPLLPPAVWNRQNTLLISWDYLCKINIICRVRREPCPTSVRRRWSSRVRVWSTRALTPLSPAAVWNRQNTLLISYIDIIVCRVLREPCPTSVRRRWSSRVRVWSTRAPTPLSPAAVWLSSTRIYLPLYKAESQT